METEVFLSLNLALYLRPLWTAIFSDEIKYTFYEIKIFYGQYLIYTTIEQ